MIPSEFPKEYEEWRIQNLNYFKVKYIGDIKIELVPSDIGTIPAEVKRKWLIGSRSIDIERDVFKTTSYGGKRIVVSSDIVVREEYKIILKGDAPKINGISFSECGKLNLIDKKGYKYKIHSMEIKEITEDSLKFISKKGYRLVEKKAELIPIWPPGRFEGDKIQFSDETAIFTKINGCL